MTDTDTDTATVHVNEPLVFLLSDSHTFNKYGVPSNNSMFAHVFRDSFVVFGPYLAIPPMVVKFNCRFGVWGIFCAGCQNLFVNCQNLMGLSQHLTGCSGGIFKSLLTDQGIKGEFVEFYILLL